MAWRTLHWFCTCLLLCFVSFIGWLSSLNVGALEMGRENLPQRISPGFAERKWNMEKMRYCWWKKSGTTWDLLSTGAGFFPSTVLPEKCDASCALVWFIAFPMLFSTQLFASNHWCEGYLVWIYIKEVFTKKLSKMKSEFWPPGFSYVFTWCIWFESKQQLGKWLQVLSTFTNPPPRETGRSPKPILQGYFWWKKSG